MIIVFNLYGKNLDKINLLDLFFDTLSFVYKDKKYELDLAGAIDGIPGECFEGRIKADVTFLGDEVLDLETALIEATDVKFNVRLDEYCEVKDVELKYYTIHVMVSNVDMIFQGTF